MCCLSRSTRVAVGDVNGDGALDLLVGDYANIAEPVAGLSEEEYAKLERAWQAENAKLEAQAPDLELKPWDDWTDEDHAAMDSFKKKSIAHYEKREKFISERSTGSVWVYLRK